NLTVLFDHKYPNFENTPSEGQGLTPYRSFEGEIKL
ncbi:MAG: hypothetical protein PWQ68_778, partial [Thermoanaerobacteraceae bacterium]|nr:hypothetical protein [Thermoanaerobacteraceae bacterium]